ncbi:hypothetical protein B2J88_51670 [Rhodococcus sp. SRB_17]|nr:hypothetical protein [Rhodococcus sp. SRB_17]
MRTGTQFAENAPLRNEFVQRASAKAITRTGRLRHTRSRRAYTVGQLQLPKLGPDRGEHDRANRHRQIFSELRDGA